MSYYPLYNTLFIGIPKTGTTTIRNILGFASITSDPQHISQEEIKLLGAKRVPNLHRRQVLDWGRHPTIENISSISNESRQLVEKAFKFSVVRNPYDRLVSAYAYYIEQHKIEKNFEQFVNEIDFKRLHLIPQHKFICIGEKICVDKIIKYENFETELRETLNLLNIFSEIPKLNISQRKPTKEYFNDYLYKIVKNIYEKDFELLDRERLWHLNL